MLHCLVSLALFANEAWHAGRPRALHFKPSPFSSFEKYCPSFSSSCLNNGRKRTWAPFEQGVRKTVRVQTANGTCLSNLVYFRDAKCFPRLLGEM